MSLPKSLATRFYTTRLVSQPFRTTDSRRTLTSRDALLSPPTASETAAWLARMATMSGLDLGRLWVGDLTSKLDAVKSADPAKFADVVETITDALANYGNGFASSTAVSGPSGSLTFNGSLSKASVDDSGGAQLRKLRDQTANEVAKINADNGAFWDKQKR